MRSGRGAVFANTVAETAKETACDKQVIHVHVSVGTSFIYFVAAIAMFAFRLVVSCHRERVKKWWLLFRLALDAHHKADAHNTAADNTQYRMLSAAIPHNSADKDALCVPRRRANA